MLHLRQENDVAGLQIFRAPGAGHEVDALGGAAGEDDFLRAFGVDEFGGARPRVLKRGRGAIAQFVDAAVDVGVVAFVIMDQRVNHHARLLRRGGVIEINQRLAVDLLVKDGKIPAERGPVWRFNGSHRGNLTTKCTNDTNRIYISPNCSFAASVIMPWFQGGSQTSSTLASSIGSSESNLFCTSCASTGPMPQPGAVKVIFTSALKLFSPAGVRWQS